MSLHFNATFWKLIGLPGEPTPKNPQTPSTQTPRKEQRISWNVPAEIEFGTLLNTLPAVTVTEGNHDDAPVYTPPLNQRRPGFGDHTLTVTVPGNAEYNEATLSMPLHVKRAKLKVTAPRLTMQVGAPLPTLTCTIAGVVLPDVVDVTLPHQLAQAPPVNMDGFPLSPHLTFTSGLAANYETTVTPGWLKVRPTNDEMEANIGIFRRRTLNLDKELHGPLFDILDQIADKRINLQVDDLADLLHQLEIDLFELDYIKVTGLAVAPNAGGAIDALETVQLTATVTPNDATVPGIRWSVDDPNLATITGNGTLTRVGKEGGQVVVTATSLCKDAIIASTTVDIRPRPQSIRLIAMPENVFLGSTVQLTAVVEPPEAEQGLTWKAIAGIKKNVATTRLGQVTVTEPSQRTGGTASGAVTMQAISTVDPTIVQEGTFRFGGYAVREVPLKVDKRNVNVGESITITARVEPPEANQTVQWTLDDPSVADMTVNGLQIVLLTKAGGPLKVTCKATDGSGVERDTTVTAKVAATGFSTTCPKTAIDIIETLEFEPVFVPPEAKARVQWLLEPANLAKIDAAGKLTPLNSGTVNVTGKLMGTEFSHAQTITITASPASPIGLDQWDILLPRIDDFAGRLLITQHHLAKAEYKRWKEDLRHAMTTAGFTKTLGQMKTELLALRNQHYQYSHSYWLAKAGFSRGGNCFIRNDGRLAFGVHNFRVHMTMFPTADQFAIGTTIAPLTNGVYRSNVGGHVSMHATLYVAEDNTDEQVKVYASGEDYVSRYTFVQRWAGRGINYVQLKAALGVWMANIQGQATNALQTAYDLVHANDNSSIA